MFKRTDQDDLSTELQDSRVWKVGTIRSFDYALHVTALAFEPVSGLLAFGTTSGSIRIHGRPGVEVELDIPEPNVAVKILQFSVSTFKLLCLDDRDKLHVWDLSSFGQPKYETSARFESVSSITVSPSHSHAFVALQAGEIRTYDLECLRKSPYTIPNIWRLHEEKLAASGILDSPVKTSGILIDTVIHPRDLNLLFAAYAGGVILYDLQEKHTLRVYELILPPGAPGGTGYNSSDILTHRRPEVTCIAVHPAGHLFVTGYTDGIFAFWAMEDEDQPLMVRTLDDLSVNVVDGIMLEKAMAQEQPEHNEREPIFKMSWSGFPSGSDLNNGKTVLTILGGLLPGASPGLNVLLFSAFNPTNVPSTGQDGHRAALHPGLRLTMRESIEPTNTYFYSTGGVAQDYLLLARDNPHFSGTFDPTIILFLIESTGETRVVEAYTFPPPLFNMLPSQSEEFTSESDTLSDLSSTLHDLQMNEECRKLRLPSSLWFGNSNIVGGQLVKVERDAYDSLISEHNLDKYLVPLKGGVAWTEATNAKEQKFSKYQPHRLWITYHKDLTVQFQDASAQLLIGYKPTPIAHDFPGPLPSLTIDLSTVLNDPTVSKLMPRTSNPPKISNVHFATESLDCTVILETGHVVVFRLKQSGLGSSLRKESSDSELVSIDHILQPPYRRYSPYCLLMPRTGSVATCALADVGFLAVAYADASLVVVDLQALRIIIRHGLEDKSKHKLTKTNLPGQLFDPISSLTWTISPLESDQNLRVRLVIVYSSGRTRIFSVVRGSQSSQWLAVREPAKFDMEGKVLSQGSFVLNVKTGTLCKADKARFSAASRGSPSDGHVFFLTAGVEGAKCNLDISGDRIAKVDWDADIGKVIQLQVVEKTGSHCLVVFTDRSEVLVYSIPYLRCLHRLSISHKLTSLFTADETGDFIAWYRDVKSGVTHRAIYGTLFDFRRINSLPEIDFLYEKQPIPPQPQLISIGPTSLLSSWFSFGQTMTGEHMDILLGGPDRPIPEKSLPIKTPDEPTSKVNAAGTMQSNLYERLTSALSERGQALSNLEDRFNVLESESRNMVAQAKRLAAEQTAKSWFKI